MVLDRGFPAGKLAAPSEFLTTRVALPLAQEKKMNKQDRRLFPRYSLRIPVRFRIADLSADMSEHATEAVNVSRYGLLLATRSAMRVGATLDLTVRVPVEISGMAKQEARCKGRIVHECALEDGRIGYGVQIERMTPPCMRVEGHDHRVPVGTS
jgi:hypothetical protein